MGPADLPSPPPLGGSYLTEGKLLLGTTSKLSIAEIMRLSPIALALERRDGIIKKRSMLELDLGKFSNLIDEVGNLQQSASH